MGTLVAAGVGILRCGLIGDDAAMTGRSIVLRPALHPIGTGPFPCRR